MKSTLIVATVALIATVGKGQTHEFWIEPLAYQVQVGETVEANLHTGQEFVGVASSFLPRNFERFDVVVGGETQDVVGRLGDIPAFAVADLPDGLAVIVHQTTQRLLTWTTWEQFFDFAAHKDLGDVVAMQAARGLDQEDVREGYFRYAKSLVAIGDGTGGDRRVGLYTELVALANPYTDDVSDGMPVQLWLQDAPRADEQVELFEMAPDGTVTISEHRTDADGIAILPVVSGNTYMADAVTLEPIEPIEADDPEWLTHWANLTFAVP